MPMQTTTINFGGVDIDVEAQSLTGSQQTSTAERAREHVVDSFDRVRETVIALAAATADTIQSAATAARPEEVEVEFGLKFTVSGNVIVAGAAGEANLLIRLKYVRH